MPTLEHAFGIRNLMMMAEAFSEDEDGRLPTTELFRSGDFQQVEFGEMVNWDRQDAERQLAPFGSDCAPSIRTHENEKTANWTPMINIRINRRIKAKKIFVNERNLCSLVPNAEAKIAREMRMLTRMIWRSVEFICSGLVFSTTGVAVTPGAVPGSTVSFTLNFGITGLTATASWGNAATLVLGDMRDHIDDIKTASGITPTRAYFENEVGKDLLNNTQAREWLSRSTNGLPVFNTGDFNRSGGMGGIGQWNEWNHQYQNVGGAATKFVPVDRVLILPDRLDNVLGFAEGADVVPMEAIGGGNASGIQRSDPGLLVYSVIEPDPPAIKLVAVYNFAAIVKIPQAVGLIDVS